jgi:hypothetical protein
MPPIQLNYLAVVVAAVVAFIIGMLWYSVLFRRQWMAAQGYTPEKIAAAKQGGMGGKYAATFVATLVTAAVLGVLISRMGIASTLGGVKLGVIAWLGFAAPIGFTANLFSEKPRTAWYIDTAHQLVYLVVMGIILTVWR